ncbi:hypothetical protein B5807_03308 [Epicoccum nigrum]|uniref:Cyanovirin-N domain-containing protein n=1 Tax=Epicoccum nigrum TaxID=105696 RepID=A0A1Y2M5C1_EPING|nr:hypothetical protein B5807_03308 [Epicoccum nigrum]
MRLTPLLSLAGLTALTTAAPSTPPMTPRADLSDLTKSPPQSSDTCPTGMKSCGVITFRSGTYVGFGEGTCIQIKGDIDTVYVGHCYCSLWETCTGNGGQDSFVGGMSMCEKPKAPAAFGGKKVRFVSCGGLA